MRLAIRVRAEQQDEFGAQRLYQRRKGFLEAREQLLARQGRHRHRLTKGEMPIQ
jgi:hypothetical protein